jgi:hypothetical protein
VWCLPLSCRLHLNPSSFPNVKENPKKSDFSDWDIIRMKLRKEPYE